MRMTLFHSAKSNAKARGIEFSFTFMGWVTWWEANLGKNWLKKRGASPDQYCMARLGDEGPYRADNVQCITNRQNCSDRSKNRGTERASWKLGKDQMQKIYLAKGTLPQLAKKFRVSASTISSVKNGRVGGSVTKELGPAHKNRRGRPKL